MDMELKNALDNVITKHGVERKCGCDWDDYGDTFAARYGIIIILNSGEYRVFVDNNAICFQYVDDESGDVVDCYYDENETDVVNKLDDLINEYNDVTWKVYGDTDTMDYWYDCE